MPAWYVQTYKKHTRQGSRVLALAYKSLPEMTVSFFSRHLPQNTLTDAHCISACRLCVEIIDI